MMNQYGVIGLIGVMRDKNINNTITDGKFCWKYLQLIMLSGNKFYIIFCKTKLQC